MANDVQQDMKSNRWYTTGDFFTAVDAGSAILELPGSVEDKIPLDADHTMMLNLTTKTIEATLVRWIS